MNEIELPYAHLAYQAPIVQITFKDNVELGYPEIHNLIRYANILSDNKPYYIFSDARACVNITPQGRKLAANLNVAPLHKGTAVLVQPSILKTALTAFGKLIQPSVPYRLFIDRYQAVNWLKWMSLSEETAEGSARA
jgi:hypothetical protein